MRNLSDIPDGDASSALPRPAIRSLPLVFPECRQVLGIAAIANCLSRFPHCCTIMGTVSLNRVLIVPFQ
jgi:hypothetical protein